MVWARRSAALGSRGQNDRQTIFVSLEFPHHHQSTEIGLEPPVVVLYTANGKVFMFPGR